jgi:hypothetical protein
VKSGWSLGGRTHSQPDAGQQRQEDEDEEQDEGHHGALGLVGPVVPPERLAGLHHREGALQVHLTGWRARSERGNTHRWALTSLKPLGYAWSCLACRIGQLVPMSSCAEDPQFSNAGLQGTAAGGVRLPGAR